MVIPEEVDFSRIKLPCVFQLMRKPTCDSEVFPLGTTDIWVHMVFDDAETMSLQRLRGLGLKMKGPPCFVSV